MSAGHGTAVVGNIVASAAGMISFLGVFEQFAYEWIGIVAGIMSIIYWSSVFWKWIKSWFNNHGD